MSHPRQVAYDRVEGHFRLPLGLRLFDRDPYEGEKVLIVSTVQLDGAHMEDPLHIVDAETGFETMVFFEATSFFDLHSARYRTRKQAKRGHAAVLKALHDGTLPLTIQMKHYFTRKPESAAA